MSDKTGGPAFSRAACGLGAQDYDAGEAGMSMRDWFAGMALIGIAEEYGSSPEQRAERCYRFADAMLAQREKP